MNSNKMELKMNELEQVCGGFWQTVMYPDAMQIEMRKAKGEGNVISTILGGFDGTVKGLKKELLGGIF